MISIIIPTVTGREEHLKRCRDAYQKHTDIECEIIVIENLPTCGEAWQTGVEQSMGDCIHFSADDLEPHEGWYVDAVLAADDGYLAAPTIYGPDGNLEPLGPETIGCTRIPFCSRDQWEKIGPMIPAHYYTDNYFSAAGVAAGFPVLEVPSYRFNHHWAQAGRYGGEKMMQDKATYIQTCQALGIPTIP